jgi:hypothetical protein
VSQRRAPKYTGDVTLRFMWQEGGLETYKKKWQERMKIARWDLVSGIDAVARADNATWFEWDDDRTKGPRYWCGAVWALHSFLAFFGYVY